ncbi:MAG TPA: glycerophosphodiester phosphodiesterase, partial [Bryobacteraceae bacterium]|nr:glycerophosphodiester phosphodiesterase [Bryobacteraceae bacterium]
SYALLMILCLAGLLMIQVHGHRGARAIFPENTIPAFEYAIQTGVDALEMDLAVTKDNVLVVSHDPTMNPLICEGPAGPAVIRQMTLQQVKQWDCGAKQNPAFPKQRTVAGTRVPTLDEVLALAPRGRFDFNIETKIYPDRPALTPSPEEFARLLAAAIRKHNLIDRVIVQSFDFRTLHAMKKLLPKVRLSALYEPGPKDFVTLGREAGAGIVSPHQKIVTPALVKAAHEAGLVVIPWTANTPQQWDKLIEAKSDAIISDDPAALILYLKKKGLR